MENIDFNATKAIIKTFFEGKINEFNSVLEMDHYQESKKIMRFYILYKGQNHFWYVEAQEGSNADFVTITFHSDYDDRMLVPIIKADWIGKSETKESFLDSINDLWEATVGCILTADNY